MARNKDFSEENKSEKKLSAIWIVLICVVAATIIFSAAFFVFKNFLPSKIETPTTTVTEPATNPPTTGPETESDTTTTTETETTTDTSTTTKGPTSFYSGVKYRSPDAKTADIMKHGRNLMLLNKQYELPEDFQWDLVYWSNGKHVDAMSLNYQKYDSVKAVDRETYEPLKKMFEDAKNDGVPLELVSAYRSISLQDRLFTRSVNSFKNRGYSESEAIKKANISRTFSGTSEHNTGYGFDILQKGKYTLDESFENTAQFKWLSEHAAEYGFILRYPKNKTAITGIMYEPWHYRYVGTENAVKMNEMGFCLEEYIEYLDKQGE